MAAITAKGKFTNCPNSNHEIITTKIVFINADIQEFAPDLIFIAVLTNTPVTGIPPNIPEARFASPNQRTSWDWWCFVFVCLSATFAEIIVSKIATTAIGKAALLIFNKVLRPSDPVVNSCINCCRGCPSIRLNVNAGNWSLSVKKSSHSCLPIIPNITPKIVTGSTAGIDLKKRVRSLSNTKAPMNIPTVISEISEKWEKVSTIFCIILSCFGSQNSPSALLSCEKPIISHTPIINPWRAVEGIKVMYLLTLVTRKSKVKRPISIVKVVYRSVHNWVVATNSSPESAPAGPIML